MPLSPRNQTRLEWKSREIAIGERPGSLGFMRVSGVLQGRLFSHRSYLVVPKQSHADELARLDALCEISGIGLVTFDAEDPKAPGFRVHVRPRSHQPDYFYTNRYLSLIERELFS